MVDTETLPQLNHILSSCTECPLSSIPGRVPVPGWGSPNAPVMVINSAPDDLETRKGRPLVGRQGQLLVNMLRLANIQPEQVYFTNMVKCQPDKNVKGKQKDPSKKQITTCTGNYLEHEIRMINPQLIITVGAKPLQYLLPGESISDVHGQLLQWGKRALIPMTNPSVVMYRPEKETEISEDFRRVPALMERFIDGDKQEVPHALIGGGELLNLIGDLEKGERIAIDFETTGLRTWREDIVDIGVASSHWAVSVDTRSWDESLINSYLGDLLEFSKHVKIVAHNAKYEMGMMYRYGIIEFPPIDDTFILMSLLGRENKGLKAATLQEFGYKMTDIQELIGTGKDQITMRDVPADVASEYVCADVWFTLKHYDILVREMNEDLWAVYEDIERPLLPAVVEMENGGCALDEEQVMLAEGKLDVLYDIEYEEFKKTADNIGKPVKADFNPRSPDQALKWIKSTGVNVKDTNANTLMANLRDAPHLMGIIQLRHLSKLKSSYINGFKVMGDRAYGSVNPSGTETGRFSYSGWKLPDGQWGINLQTIPKPKMWEEGDNAESNLVRRCFISEPGRIFIEFDYSQIELRVAAHISQDPMMIQAYMEGRDIHNEMENTAQLGKYMPAADSESRRRVAKILNFALQYEPEDKSAVSVLLRTTAQAKVYLTEDESWSIVRAKRNAQPGMSAYYDLIKYQMQTRGYVETEYGRRLVIPWLAGSGYKIDYANTSRWRNAINMPIQGTSADMMKLAIIRLQAAYRDLPYRVRLIWTVHDSILVDAPEGRVDEVKLLSKDVMENVMKLRVPVLVDAKSGTNLAEMKG